MSFYELNLLVLVLINAGLFYRQRKRTSTKPTEPAHHDKALPEDLEAEDPLLSTAAVETDYKDFVKRYLIGHLLAFAGDWLQVRL